MIVGAKATRRRMLGFLGMAPLAGRQALEEGAKHLAGIGKSGSFPTADLRDALDLRGAPSQGVCASVDTPVSDYWAQKKLRETTLRAALAIPASRAEIESILYEDQRMVWNLDPDLAVLRSISLSAKIAYQRQRNVARQLENALLDQSPYQRIREWGENVLKNALGIKF